ncbi:hypothetical protein ABLM29_12865, partial [Nocardioides sp. YIM 152588]
GPQAPQYPPPAPTQEPLRAPVPPPGPPPYQGYPAPHQGYPAHHAPAARADRRPGALVAACVLTWVTTALVAGGLLMVSLAIALTGDELWVEFERQQGQSLADFGVTESQVTVAVYALTAIAVPWCLAAAGLALAAILGRRWARIALAVSSTLTGLFCLALAIANPALVVLVAVCAVTTWLLLRPDVAAWRR